MSDLQADHQAEISPAKSQDPMSIPERFQRGDVTLSLIWNGLSVGQLWGLCGAAVALLVGAFSLGAWITAQAGESRLRDSRTEMQGNITALETTLKQKEIEKLERERITKADTAQAGQKIAQLTRSDENLRVKQRFLVSCFS